MTLNPSKNLLKLKIRRSHYEKSWRQSNRQTRAKDVLPNINRTQAAEITSPPAATEWSRLLLRDVICKDRVTVCHAAEWTIPSLPGVMGVHSAFLSLVTLTFDLDIQTHLSEGPNTSSLWIWRKSFSGFRDIWFTNKQTKQVTDSAKNRTLHSLLDSDKKIADTVEVVTMSRANDTAEHINMTVTIMSKTKTSDGQQTNTELQDDLETQLHCLWLVSTATAIMHTDSESPAVLQRDFRSKRPAQQLVKKPSTVKFCLYENTWRSVNSNIIGNS